MTAAREGLYDRLVQVLGADHALTLMRSIPDEPPASKTDLAALRGDVTTFRTELKTDITELRTELKTDIADLRTELTDLRVDIRRIDDRIHGFYDALHAQTRVHVAASLGSAVTVAGFVFIAAQLT